MADEYLSRVGTVADLQFLRDACVALPLYPPVLDDPGVFLLCNFVEKIFLVSSARTRIRPRIRTNYVLLQRGKHLNKNLQDDWCTFGPGAFLFVPLQKAGGRDWLLAEYMWIYVLMTSGFILYNNFTRWRWFTGYLNYIKMFKN